MRVIITGGAGFIGSNAVHHFLRNEHNITVVDMLNYAADAQRIKDTNISLRIDNIDYLKWQYVLDLCKPDVLINYAALTHVDKSIDLEWVHPFVSSNVSGVSNILAGIMRSDYPPKLFVQISTDEVLGDFDFVYASSGESAGWSSEAPLNPHNLYSATKASAELIVQAMHHTYKGTPKEFKYLILRATNNYGPGQHFEKFLPTIITSVLNNRKIPVYGEGKNVREWLWVGDFVQGTEMAINKALEGGFVNGILHFGSNVRKRNIEVVNTVLDIMKAPRSLIEFVPDRLGHDRAYALDYTNTTKELGWEPKQKFEDGIESVIKDVRQRLDHGKKN